MGTPGSQNPKYNVGDVVCFHVPFLTTAAAQDKNILVMEADTHKFVISFLSINFTVIDTFASGVDIDLEIDNGTTETVLATYDTVAGTAIDTIYSLTGASNVAPVVPPGYWLQLRVDDDEDAACEGTLYIEGYFE